MILYQEGLLAFPACELPQSALHYRGYRDGQCPTKKWNKGVVWKAGVQKPNCCKNLGGSVVLGALQGEKQGSPRTWLLRRWVLFRHLPQALGLAHDQRVPSSVWQISQGQRCQPNWRCRHVGAIKYQCQNECHLGIQSDKGSRGVSVSKKGEVLDTVPKTLWGQTLVLLHPVYIFSVHLSLFPRVFEGRDYALIFVSIVPSLYLTALQ